MDSSGRSGTTIKDADVEIASLPSYAGKGPAPVEVLPPTTAPTNAVARFGERFFRVHERGSTWLGEFRWGCETKGRRHRMVPAWLASLGMGHQRMSGTWEEVACNPRSGRDAYFERPAATSSAASQSFGDVLGRHLRMGSTPPHPVTRLLHPRPTHQGRHRAVHDIGEQASADPPIACSYLRTPLGAPRLRPSRTIPAAIDPASPARPGYSHPTLDNRTVVLQVMTAVAIMRSSILATCPESEIV
jgi:hypothetical protein